MPAHISFITQEPVSEVMAHLERCGVPVRMGPGPRAGAIGMIQSATSMIRIRTQSRFLATEPDSPKLGYAHDMPKQRRAHVDRMAIDTSFARASSEDTKKIS